MAGVILAFVAIVFALAARRGREAVEVEPHVPHSPGPSPPPFAVALPPPRPSEVEDGLHRAFGDTVRAGPSPRYLVGDFNGDGAEDLAVPVSPVESRLGDLNDSLANWNVQDALGVPPPRSGPAPLATSAPVTVQPNDVLLAVVHGYGGRGWRDGQARQCYLVRHATGAPLEARPRSVLLRYVEKAPSDARLSGDVILASAGKKDGFVYWTGVRYAWHPLPKKSPPHPALSP